MANVVTDAEARVIKKANIAKVRELDFAQLFGENITNLIKLLGITRKIPVQAGTVLKVMKVTGTLQSGEVPEGEIIPLSQYATTWTPIGEMKLNKWRKGTTAEAILKGGYDQAVNETNAKLIRDIQKGIRSDFITYLGLGTGSASGTNLQSALADAWGQLQVKFEDDDVQAVYIMNPLDVADYLKTAQITTQTAFGFTYVENFLGLGTVILTAQVTKGTFFATASQNIVAYYIDARGADGLGEAFDFTTDPETGFVGVHEEGNYERLQSETVAIAGVDIFAEAVDGIIVGTIDSNPLNAPTVSPVDGSVTEPWGGRRADSFQSDVSVANGTITGELTFVEGGLAPSGYLSGDGYFIYLKLTDIDASANSLLVGLEPSAGSGLQEAINDPDKTVVCKVASNDQKFVTIIKNTENGKQTRTNYTLDLTFVPADNDDNEGV